MKNKKNLNRIMYAAIAVLTIVCCVLLVAIIDTQNLAVSGKMHDTTEDFTNVTENKNSSTNATEETKNEATSVNSQSETKEEKEPPSNEKHSGKTDKPKNPSNHQGEGKFVYLTFDDGPSYVTDEILDILDSYNIKATFFVVYHKDNENRLKEIHKRGHSIGLHSYTHDYKKIYTSTDAYFEDLQKISDYVEDTIGVKSKIIRFPGGTSNEVSKSYSKGIMSRLAPMVLDKGYSFFDWNCDSGDANGSGVPADKLIQKVINTAPRGSGNINVLMHDAPDKSTTAKALPSIIEYFRDAGYEFRPLTEDSYPVRHAINN